MNVVIFSKGVSSFLPSFPSIISTSFCYDSLWMSDCGGGFHFRPRRPHWGLLQSQAGFRQVTFTPSHQIHIEAVSALYPASFCKIRLSQPTIPSIFNTLYDEFPVYPWHSYSIWKHHVFQHSTLYCSTRSLYLSIFLSYNYFIRSSHGTVNSIMMHIRLLLENMTISGRK